MVVVVVVDPLPLFLLLPSPSSPWSSPLSSSLPSSLSLSSLSLSLSLDVLFLVVLASFFLLMTSRPGTRVGG